MPDPGESTTKPVTDWLNGQAAGGALLLGVCNGSGVLASAGLLDGRDATAHWLRLDAFEDDHPAVDWVRGTRYVDDGDVITTAGILSGVDGTLRVVERLVGTARRGPRGGGDRLEALPPRRRGLDGAGGQRPADAVVGFNTAFGRDRDRTGVLLTDGVGEIEPASVFALMVSSRPSARWPSPPVSSRCGRGTG